MAVKIGIVDIGLGNVNSVARAVAHLGHHAIMCGEPESLRDIDKLIFPGVGNFSAAMLELRRRALDVRLRELVLQQGMPIFGICLGMQLLAAEGEEGGRTSGLGLVEARVSLLPIPDDSVRLPHVGWNEVEHEGGRLYAGIPTGECFYFVHSYAMVPAVPLLHVGRTSHGSVFVSSIESGPVMGVQFHPEKSRTAGLRLLRNYIEC